MIEKTYSQLMGEQAAFLTLKIDTDEPVELRDFVGGFTSLANEFERFVKDAHPGVKSDPRMYVREVRHGCVEADMITGFFAAAITQLDQILILEDFVKRWGKRFLALRTGQVAPGELETNKELKDWADAAKTIACDPIASHRLEAATYEDGKREVRASFVFTAPEARTALQNIDDRRKLLAKPVNSPHERVLMKFTRTDVHDATINKRSDERVLILEVSEKERPVMYASELVEQEIREAIRDADENVYKRGFVVDVMAQMEGDKILIYSVMQLHKVIDLGD
jgi:hypothetical protein